MPELRDEAVLPEAVGSCCGRGYLAVLHKSTFTSFAAR
jgi:hypothetical protein